MKALLVGLLILSPLAANPKPQESTYPFDTGSLFLQNCKLDQMNAMTIMCGFYAKGIADGFMVAEIEHNTKRTICPRNGTISADQAARVVRKYIEDNPQLLDISVMILAYRAYQQAFPCSEQKP